MNFFIFTDYLALIATGNKGDIPWWSNFFRNGIALLRNEAGSQIFEKLNQADSTIFRFPLCRDAALENEFRESELLAAWETLKMLNQNMTFEKGIVKNTKDANKALSMFHTLDVSSILDKKDYQWLDNILLITEALVNRNKPLIWTITIPDMKQ